MLRRSLFLLLLVLLARCGTTPAIDCNLTMVAQMPLQVEHHLLVVPVGINGKWVRLVVDSGAQWTILNETAAERLKLPRDPRQVARSAGIGGATTVNGALIDRLVIGNAHFQTVDRLAVGNLDPTASELNVDGLLGADILLGFDMDIDVPDQKLTLYSPRVCPDARPPWPEQAVELTGVTALKDRVRLPFELDNVAGTALLDTGAQGNVLGVTMARRMGLNDQTMAGDPVVRQHGVGPQETVSRLHRFSQMRVGTIVFESPKMAVLPSDLQGGDALLGEPFLQGRRVWISFRSRQVFVSKRSNER
jgi:predicted aspartyl protease